MRKTILLTMILAASAAFAAVPQRLAYRGVLDWTDREQVVTSREMTFRLYDSKTPGTALWARTMRVPVDTNGVFYAELSDANGTDPDEIGSPLVEALAAVKGTPEIGLTLTGFPELAPRQKLGVSPRAARAARAKAADVVYAPTGAYAEGVNVNAAAVDQITVQKGASKVALPERCSLVKLGEGKVRELGGGQSQISVRDLRTVRPASPSCFSQSSFKYTTNGAPCDMVLTYENNDGVFNVIVPAGGKIVDGGAASDVCTVSGTAFGNP